MDKCPYCDGSGLTEAFNLCSCVPCCQLATSPKTGLKTPRLVLDTELSERLIKTPIGTFYPAFPYRVEY